MVGAGITPLWALETSLIFPELIYLSRGVCLPLF